MITAAIWGVYSWCKEWELFRKGIDPSTDAPASDFRPPDAINLPALAFLVAKCFALLAGGCYLLHYLWQAQMPGII